MYEKHGLMVKITNPTVLAYLRSNPQETNRWLVEAALCDMLCIPPKPKKVKRKSRCKAYPDNLRAMPVKISAPDLIEFITNQRDKYGILQRHTVETALLRYMERQQKDAE